MRAHTSRTEFRSAAISGTVTVCTVVLTLLAGALRAQSTDDGASLSTGRRLPIRNPICLACPAIPVHFVGTSESGNYQEALDAALKEADAHFANAGSDLSYRYDVAGAFGWRGGLAAVNTITVEIDVMGPPVPPVPTAGPEIPITIGNSPTGVSQ